MEHAVARTAPSRQQIEHALLLIGRIHKAQPEAAQAAREALARWRSIDDAHTQAAEQAQRLWDAADGSALQGRVPLPPFQAGAQQARRRAIGLLGGGGIAALMAGGMYWQRHQPLHEIVLATGHAQQLGHTLPDGTRLVLGARTTARIAYYRDRREVALEAGDIHFQVAADASRPFTVATGGGRVRVLGTVFSVSVHGGRMHVAVAEGRVAVWAGQGDVAPAANKHPAATLGAGERIEADGLGLGPRGTVPASDVGAWRDGWLVFDDTPLPEALARWNDYLQHPLRLGVSPALRGLRISGSFPLRKPQTFLDGLPGMLPVRVVHGVAGIVTIEAR
jgi:transmembrane sensor